MSDKTFTIIGTSKFKGVNTFRVATGKIGTRIAVLKRNGHEDIALMDMAPQQFTKAQAQAHLEAQGVQAVWSNSSKKAEAPAAPAVELTPEQKKAAAQAKRKATIAAKKAAKEAEAAAAAPEGQEGGPVGNGEDGVQLIQTGGIEAMLKDGDAEVVA